MRKALVAALALTAAAGAALAATAQDAPRRVRTATICVDAAGRVEPPTCRVPASRLERREDLCVCAAGDKVDAPICPSGVAPPPESRELEQARRRAVDAGGLIGAEFQGRPICVKG